MSRRPYQRERGPRPTSPASSSSGSASSDDDDSTHLTLIGTPIDATERHYRAIRLQRQQQQSQHGEREAAGFTPAAFVSSRQRRWQGEEATVEEYMDDKDVSEQTRDRLQVRADIEASRRGGEDALQLAIAPRRETVARRILRRMGRKDGRGVGTKRPAAPTLERASRVRRRPTVSAALPPSMQALLDEDDEDAPSRSQPRAPPREETKDEHAVADDDGDEADDDEPLHSDVPLFQPPLKDELFGLGFDPLLHAEEFAAHRDRQLQQRRRKQEEEARDAVLLDDAMDEVVELSRGGPGRVGQGGRARVPGFRVLDDEEADDDEVEVYEDRAEYDTHIGRLKRDKRQKEDEERKEAAEVEESNGRGELVFVKGEMGGVGGGDAGDAWEVPRDWDERKVWDEAEEAVERDRMKAVVREWADGRRAQLRARQDEAQQQQRQHAVESKVDPPPHEPIAPSRPEPPPVAAPPPQSTADMLASGFFSRFTMGASTASASASPALPMPPPPPPVPAAAVPFTLRQLRHEVLVWDPSPLLCRRLGVVPPPRRENAANSATNHATTRTNKSQPAEKMLQRRRHQHAAHAASDAAETQAAQLRAPLIIVDRPSSAVLSAIFDDADDRGDEERARAAQQQWLETEAMRLLSSIVLPSSHTAAASTPASVAASAALLDPAAVAPFISENGHPSRSLQMDKQSASSSFVDAMSHSASRTPHSLASAYTAAPVRTASSASVSGTVHPSRQHLVPAAPSTAKIDTNAMPAARRSRWGDRADAVSAAAPLPTSAPTPFSPDTSPPPLGPPTPPSLRRAPLTAAPSDANVTAASSASGEQRKAALRAALLAELAALEQQSVREKQQRRAEKSDRREKRRERHRGRHRSRSSGRSSRERRERHADSYADGRHHRRASHCHSSDSDSDRRSSNSSVHRESPPRRRVRSARVTDVVDLT